jgi:glycosyltransferase involved in cell wall biosynthesis
MKIALVHDYLREYGGAERVLETLHEIYSDAPLYTSFVDFKALGKHTERFKKWEIRTSWVQNYPLIKKYISPLRFLAPKIWSSFDLSEYDVVISSSGWFMCRGVIVKKPAVHICYIHHPPRNLYGYATGSTLQKYPFVRMYAALINHFLRKYDFQTAQKVDYFISNSKETARRVEKFYRRDSTVIYPPITHAVGSQQSAVSKKRTYYLSVGRLSWAKRVDVIIKACNELNVPLKIVGTGKEEAYLRSIAARPPSAGVEGAVGRRPTTEFVGSVSDAELAQLYEGAKALLFCALDEDFGMVPVEAMGYGTPVIALAEGGVKETVIDRKTGVTFEKPEVEELKKAIEKFEKGIGKQNVEMTKNCIIQAKKFGKEQFKTKIKEFVEKHGHGNP